MKIIHISKNIIKEAAFKATYDVGPRGYPSSHQEKYLFLPSKGDVDRYVRHTERANGEIKNFTIEEVSDAQLPAEIKELRFKRLREQEEANNTEERSNRPSTPRGPRSTPSAPRSKVTVIPKGLAPNMIQMPKTIINEKVEGNKLWKLEASPSLSEGWELFGAWGNTRREAENAIIDYLTEQGAEDPLINSDYIRTHYYGESGERVPQGGIGKQDTV